MPFKLPDGRLVSPDAAFTLNEIQYPANFLRLSTEEEKQTLGIAWVDPGPSWDQRFYWGPDLPKDHGQLVEQWTQQTRTTANTLLQPTDWIIIREADNGKPADAALKQWREAIRTATGVKIMAIGQTADTAELAAYVTSADYSTWTDDTNAPADGVVFAVDGFTTGAMITG